MSPEKNQEAMDRIDRGIEEAHAITIEQALHMAVESGNMTIKEAEACLEAYLRTLGTE